MAAQGVDIRPFAPFVTPVTNGRFITDRILGFCFVPSLVETRVRRAPPMRRVSATLASPVYKLYEGAPHHDTGDDNPRLYH